MNITNSSSFHIIVDYLGQDHIIDVLQYISREFYSRVAPRFLYVVSVEELIIVEQRFSDKVYQLTSLIDEYTISNPPSPIWCWQRISGAVKFDKQLIPKVAMIGSIHADFGQMVSTKTFHTHNTKKKPAQQYIMQKLMSGVFDQDIDLLSYAVTVKYRDFTMTFDTKSFAGFVTWGPDVDFREIADPVPVRFTYSCTYIQSNWAILKNITALADW